VCISDLSSRYGLLQEWNPYLVAGAKPKNNPKEKVYTKTFHNSSEGYALDWCPIRPGMRYFKRRKYYFFTDFLFFLGRLASGSCDGKIYIYNAKNHAFNDWERDQNPYVYHEGSVEDLQFSPVEEYSLASCKLEKELNFIFFLMNLIFIKALPTEQLEFAI